MSQKKSNTKSKKNNYKFGLVNHPSGKFRIAAHDGNKMFYINSNKKYFKTAEKAKQFLEKYMTTSFYFINASELAARR